MEFVDKIKQKAKSNIKTIVLPEAYEERNLKAADRILSEGFAKLILGIRIRSIIWLRNSIWKISGRRRSSIRKTIPIRKSTWN